VPAYSINSIAGVDIELLASSTRFFIITSAHAWALTQNTIVNAGAMLKVSSHVASPINQNSIEKLNSRSSAPTTVPYNEIVPGTVQIATITLPSNQGTSGSWRGDFRRRFVRAADEITPASEFVYFQPAAGGTRHYAQMTFQENEPPADRRISRRSRNAFFFFAGGDIRREGGSSFGSIMFNVSWNDGLTWQDRRARMLGNAQSEFWNINVYGVAAPSILAGDTGAFSETGNAIALLKSSLLPGAAGSYAETGNTAALFRLFFLFANTGAFSESGSNASLIASRLLAGNSGAFSETGNAISLLRSLLLTASTGNYNVNGNAAALLKNSGFAGNTGAFSINENAASLLRAALIAGATGGFSINGNAAALLRSSLLAAATGAFIETGDAANLFRLFHLIGASGIFNLNANAAALLKSSLLRGNTGEFIEIGGPAELFRLAKYLLDFQRGARPTASGIEAITALSQLRDSRADSAITHGRARSAAEQTLTDSHLHYPEAES
jgi:hypothetical protein